MLSFVGSLEFVQAYPHTTGPQLLGIVIPLIAVLLDESFESLVDVDTGDFV